MGIKRKESHQKEVQIKVLKIAASCYDDDDDVAF